MPRTFDDLKPVITRVDEWLDDLVVEEYKAQPLAQDWARVHKIAEELGEVTDALIGATGQNPRKGYYGDMSKVYDELADVVFTGILAIQHFTKDADETFDILYEKMGKLKARVSRCP